LCIRNDDCLLKSEPSARWRLALRQR